jgi:hypothetical protein
MRTTIELPDPLFKHLKTLAAFEGLTLRDLVVALVERGLQAPAIDGPVATKLPSIALGAPMALKSSDFSNASLASFLDD